MTKTDTVKEAITDAWCFWLSQHDITVPDCIELAARHAITDWLDRNPEVLADAIARRFADQPAPDADGPATDREN